MTETLILETERLLIRPFLPGDLEAAHRILDIELGEVNLGSEGAKSPSDRREWLEWSMLSYRQLEALYQPPYGDRAVALKAAGEGSGSVIGVVGFVPSFGPFGQLPSFGGQRSHNTPEFGLFYVISPRYQRQGYAAEAVQAMIQYAFNVLDLARIIATTTDDNAASMAVMRRLGMRVEHNPYPDPPWFQVVGILENPG